jgi:lipooligosaccharide transport system permease protein
MAATVSERRFHTPGAIRMWESQFKVYLTIWKSNVLGAFVQPLLYMLGMGLGVGALVDESTNASQQLDGLSYFQFLAPALIATSAMMVTTSEAMFPVMAGFKWIRTFHAAAATPLSPGQIAAGVGLWQATKALITGGGVALALLLFDATRSTGLPLAVVFAGLTGTAFAAPITAWAATREQERSFPSINRFVITPLFLFGGAFYPISELPEWLQWVAKATPIWHGVELCRDAVTHRLELGSTVGHIGYLLAFVVVGWVVARRTFSERLGS